MKAKNLEYYLNLDWTYTIETSTDNKLGQIFIIQVNELPGVNTDGSTIAEAMESIKEAMTGAIKLHLKQGEEIPVPISQNASQSSIS